MSKKILDEIDDYADSVFAILGFANFYRYDDKLKVMRDNVHMLQGWRFTTKPGNKNFVTPDLGLWRSDQLSAVCEVKKSFPIDSNKWMDTFQQLKGYDKKLGGLPVKGFSSEHDIVLLTHISRSRLVRKYYYENIEAIKAFKRRFIIVEFSRSSEAKPYFFFRVEDGTLSDTGVHKALEAGKQVPMAAFAEQYSTIKFYDTEPPIVYLMEMIWLHILAINAERDSKFTRLRTNQKIAVQLTVTNIANELQEKFSCCLLLPNHIKKGHPKVPTKAWVRKACNQFVQIGDGEWIGTNREELFINFRKRKNVLDYFIEKSNDLGEQTLLFPEDLSVNVRL